MASSTPKRRAGEDVDSFCQACGLMLAHIVIAVAAGKIARVECKTCRAVHGFRRPPGSPAPASERARRPAAAAAGRTRATGARRRSASDLPTLAEALVGRDPASATPWRLDVAFAEGDLMRHPRFAVGLVRRVLADSKVEVLFGDAGGDAEAPGTLKVLAHARPQN